MYDELIHMSSKRKLLFSMAFIWSFFVACSAQTTNPLNTKTPIFTFFPSNTPVQIQTPTKVNTPTVIPTFTAPVLSNSELPTDWKIYESPLEFEKTPIDIFNIEGSSYFQTGFGWSHSPKVIDFNGHELRVSDYDKDNDVIEITIDQTAIISMECDNKQSIYGYNVISALAYDNHWIVEILCNDERNIILDGQFLNETNHYSNSFSPYFISGKLFFFFYRNKDVGYYYDGKEYLLNYEMILYHHCCGISELNPIFYKDQVRFFAVRGGNGEYTYENRYEVIMGVSKSP